VRDARSRVSVNFLGYFRIFMLTENELGNYRFLRGMAPCASQGKLIQRVSGVFAVVSRQVLLDSRFSTMLTRCVGSLSGTKLRQVDSALAVALDLEIGPDSNG